ncbi:MAG: lipid A biosynthesis lauroyl acyltransferase [Mesorhizobium sp.]
MAWRTINRLAATFRDWRHWLTAKLVLGVFALFRMMDADKALNFADRWARRIGPLTGRHRIALDNLRQAYPEKSKDEIETIALDMWANMARLFAEYVFLDRLFEFDPYRNGEQRVEVDGIDKFLALYQVTQPRIFFTAHTGSFEMIPLAASAFGLQVAALFRAPNNPYMADELNKARHVSGAHMVASRSGAAVTLARLLEQDGNIGALVDQKFMGGIRTTFFGRECETSPLVPRLARQFEPAIHPVRCIRLPGNRFRLELSDAIEPPRSADGQIDAAALAQQLNDIVEGWVREYPGQWMWFHKRWEIRARKRVWKK